MALLQNGFPFVYHIRSILNPSALDLRLTLLLLANLIALSSPELPICSKQFLLIVYPLQACCFHTLPAHLYVYFSLPHMLSSPRPVQPSCIPFYFKYSCSRRSPRMFFLTHQSNCSRCYTLWWYLGIICSFTDTSLLSSAES